MNVSNTHNSCMEKINLHFNAIYHLPEDSVKALLRKIAQSINSFSTQNINLPYSIIQSLSAINVHLHYRVFQKIENLHECIKPPLK